eukprot:scaffold81033_cov39-Phaeocystis_antarctica.AAC.1
MGTLCTVSRGQGSFRSSSLVFWTCQSRYNSREVYLLWQVIVCDRCWRSKNPYRPLRGSVAEGRAWARARVSSMKGLEGVTSSRRTAASAGPSLCVALYKG